MQLEEGVDVVNEHEEQLVVTAERNAERTERRRDSSSQSDLGAISCLVPCVCVRWFLASQRPRTSHVGSVLASTMATWAREKARHMRGPEKEDATVFL